jgi:hypothetical protein
MSKKLKDKPQCKIPSIKEKCFNINIQPPFTKIDHLINYLGHYTHKTAISNHRIRSMDNQGVTFSCKDCRDKTNRVKEMFLTGEEFLRRFCLHIQYKGFRKIRYFGLFSSANRNLLNSVRMDFGQEPVPPRKKDKWREVVREVWKYGSMTPVFVLNVRRESW